MAKPRRKRAAALRAQPEYFELSILGGAVERRYRRFRPELEKLPWGSLAAMKMPASLRARAREIWTGMAFFEYRAAAAMSMTVHALAVARAPIDLVAVASRFITEELSHAELCARVLGELGGGVPFEIDPENVYPPPPAEFSPFMRAADLATRVFVLGEAFSLSVSHAALPHHSHPLVAAIQRRIAKDEAAHGAFGWIVLDWAAERFTDEDRSHIDGLIHEGVASYRQLIDEQVDSDEPTLGWLRARDFRRYAEQALEYDICAPMRARGLYTG